MLSNKEISSTFSISFYRMSARRDVKRGHTIEIVAKRQLWYGFETLTIYKLTYQPQNWTTEVLQVVQEARRSYGDAVRRDIILGWRNGTDESRICLLGCR